MAEKFYCVAGTDGVASYSNVLCGPKPFVDVLRYLFQWAENVDAVPKSKVTISVWLDENGVPITEEDIQSPLDRS